MILSQEMDAIPEGGAFPSLTIQKSYCLYGEHGRGPQLRGLGPSRKAEALASEPEPTLPTPHRKFLFLPVGAPLINDYGAQTGEGTLSSRSDSVSPEDAVSSV